MPSLDKDLLKQIKDLDKQQAKLMSDVNTYLNSARSYRTAFQKYKAMEKTSNWQSAEYQFIHEQVIEMLRTESATMSD